MQVLGPTMNMGAVTTMLERGVRKIRDSLVSFSRQLNKDVDISDLADANIVLPIVWRLGAKNMMTAVDLTAHQRYEHWHQEVFRGTKRSHDDESYEPESESSSSSSSSSISSEESLAHGVVSSSRAGNNRNRNKRVRV
jgi:hypothetical protein